MCFCGGVCSDKVSGPLYGTAEHHAEDHPKDLWRGGDRNTGSKPLQSPWDAVSEEWLANS